MKPTKEGITAQVLDVIQCVRGSSVKEPLLTLDMEVVKDLHLEEDTGDVILMLQRRTSIKPPKRAWEEVKTIGDIIELLLKYAPE